MMNGLKFFRSVKLLVTTEKYASDGWRWGNLDFDG